MLQNLIDAIIEMREEDALSLTHELLEQGTAPMDVLEACRQATNIIGKRFETGESFIPELIMAGEMMTAITAILKPRMAEGAEDVKLGKVVIGTVQGDIHDIGKDIVAFMLDLNGLEVTDLGVNVSPNAFVEAVKESKAKIVALSGFLTLAFNPMKETVAALKEAGLDDVKVMIGGGQVDDQIREFTGADAYGDDAMDAVAIAQKWAKE